MSHQPNATEKKPPPGFDPDEPKIDAVCLIPEIDMRDGLPAGTPKPMMQALRELHVYFARRFTHGYHVSPKDGLLSVQLAHEPSGVLLTDMPHDKRHYVLLALRDQLGPLLGDGRPCISLVGSTLAQAMRRIGLEYQMPLAAMSQRQRRQKLEEWMRMHSDTLCHRLFGYAVIYGDPYGDKPCVVSNRIKRPT